MDKLVIIPNDTFMCTATDFLGKATMTTNKWWVALPEKEEEVLALLLLHGARSSCHIPDVFDEMYTVAKTALSPFATIAVRSASTHAFEVYIPLYGHIMGVEYAARDPVTKRLVSITTDNFI